VDFNDSAVERNCFYCKTEYLLMLKALKYAVKNTVLAPTVHTCVNGMPTAKILRQTTPLAPMLRNIQDRIQHLEVVKTDISPLARKAVSNSLILFASDLHSAYLQNTRILSNSVNTP